MIESPSDVFLYDAVAAYNEVALHLVLWSCWRSMLYSEGMLRITLPSLRLMLLCCALPGCLSSPGDDDEARDLCDEIVRVNGYPCQNYSVTTKDGFMLGLHRIPHGYDNNGKTFPRPPIFLQHGLLQGGDTWVLNSRDQSLAYILADEGFDVWIGNGRGTRWSAGHVSHAKQDKEFWDWSWDELAAYDIPALLNFVYTATQVKIFYVGHSQGTIMGLAAFTQNTVIDFVAAAALLSPITYLNHIKSSFVDTAARYYIERCHMLKWVCLLQADLLASKLSASKSLRTAAEALWEEAETMFFNDFNQIASNLSL